MEWQVILALVIVIPIILVPVALIWYLNISGTYSAVKERRFRIFDPIIRLVRIGVAVIVPLGCYGVALWLSLGHFGWPAALAVGLALPIVLFVPVLVWGALVSGLYHVARDRLRRRVFAPQRRTVRMAEEPVTREVI